MAKAAIPVDLFNPGQIFACMGFLEAAEKLFGDAQGGFDWSDEVDVKFLLDISGERNPFEGVLEFLAEAEPKEWGPVGLADLTPAKAPDEDDGNAVDDQEAAEAKTFPAKRADRMALPIHFGGGNRPIVELGHWADGSSRGNFKLYAGNRSADKIARSMLMGTRGGTSAKKKGSAEPGNLKTKGIAQLWKEDRKNLIERPLQILTPMGGSFNFDPRGAWTAIDAGYSPNDQKHQVTSSPVVEFLSAWGLENSRPHEFEPRIVRYAVWGIPLPLMLARAALGGSITVVPLKRFRFELDMSGKNKVVTFAELENQP